MASAPKIRSRSDVPSWRALRSRRAICTSSSRSAARHTSAAASSSGEGVTSGPTAHPSRSLKPTPRTVSISVAGAPASSSLRRSPLKWESTVRSVSA